jgi:hypothetical protein
MIFNSKLFIRFHLCGLFSSMLAGNVLRYEKLPIAGDFLSSYTEVDAGYKP